MRITSIGKALRALAHRWFHPQWARSDRSEFLGQMSPRWVAAHRSGSRDR